MIKVKVKKRKSGMAACIDHTGAYGSLPFDELIGRLYAWAKDQGARPGFRPFAIYMNNPHETPAEELITRVAIPIGKKGESRDGVEVLDIPEMEVASTRFKGPTEEYSATYSELAKWTEDNGYEVTAPPMEIYTRKPKVVDGKSIIFSEVLFPVKRKE